MNMLNYSLRDVSLKYLFTTRDELLKVGSVKGALFIQLGGSFNAPAWV
jgi:hypothetical protein